MLIILQIVFFNTDLSYYHTNHYEQAIFEED